MVKSKGGGKKKSNKTSGGDVHMDEDMYFEPIKRTIVPENQLNLTDTELNEEMTRVLTANNPNVPANIIKYNFKDKCYKVDPPGSDEHLAIHFSMDGCSLHIDSDEAKAQEAFYKRKAEELETKRKEQEQESGGGGQTPSSSSSSSLNDDDDEEKEEAPPDAGKNQFNYSERAAQTFNNPMKERGVATQPPPVINFQATLTQWEIYDSYFRDYVAQLQEEEFIKNADKRKAKKASGSSSSSSSDDQDDAQGGGNGQKKDDDMVHSQKMASALRVMEKMVNQNAEDEIFMDFKFWEDASDLYRQGEGSLLPLWRFSTDRTKKKQVTAVGWNPSYQDMFAVGYGSYDFLRQGTGLVCCFSLKNTSHPEYTFSTESGVMCLDFHPQYHSLLVVGCYDGTVLVYDIRTRNTRPIYSSNIKSGKHTDPVWKVYWQEEDLAKELNFYSISSDGLVANWIMSKNELKMEPVMQLRLVSNSISAPGSSSGGGGGGDGEIEDANISGLAGGSCFDFNRFNDHLFIVGTEEGKIHKCSKAYSGQYLETYEGHHMSVYGLKWNTFHPRVFISCSADWTVKVWDHDIPYPIMSFDLGCSVGDVSWSPHSSTIFSAVTSDGKVHVFDLYENKHEPLCEQKVVKKARLTHIEFNKKDPILIVGDDRGGVNSLKLSPNLRKLHHPESSSEEEEEQDTGKLEEKTNEDGTPVVASQQKGDEEINYQIQFDKMERLLASADPRPLK